MLLQVERLLGWIGNCLVVYDDVRRGNVSLKLLFLVVPVSISCEHDEDGQNGLSYVTS